MSETVLVIVGFALVLVFTGIKMVPQGNAWTVERFGRFTYTLAPGLHWIIPFVDSIGHKLITMEQVLDVEPQEVISADNAMVTTDAVCFFQVQSAERAAYEVNDLPRALRNLVMTNIRAVLGSMDLDEMLSKRDKINSEILVKVDEATNPWGVKVTRIEIKDITPPADLVDAMALQMKAVRAKRATITEAEGRREAEITVADGQREAEILRSQGELEAAKNDALGRERLAEAEANATRTVSEAITDGNKDALSYFIAQGYTKALAEIGSADNAKVIMMPLEASSLIGSVEGIRDLLTTEKGDKS